MSQRALPRTGGLSAAAAVSEPRRQRQPVRALHGAAASPPPRAGAAAAERDAEEDAAATAAGGAAAAEAPAPPSGSLAKLFGGARPAASLPSVDEVPGACSGDFEFLSEIGRGAFGVVHRVRSRITKQLYACKVVNVGHMPPAQQRTVVREVLLLRRLWHPHIIRYHTSFVEGKALYIVTELASAGDLHALVQRLRRSKKRITERAAWRIVAELASAIAHMHTHNIVHRDLKLLNVFLSHDGRVKVGDLGLGKLLKPDQLLLETHVGTPMFIAPELVQRKPYDFKVDIWSLGCLMYALLALQNPFEGDGMLALANAIVSDTPKALPSVYSDRLRSLVTDMLAKDSAQRPSIHDIVAMIPPVVLAQASPSPLLETANDEPRRPRSASGQRPPAAISVKQYVPAPLHAAGAAPESAAAAAVAAAGDGARAPARASLALAENCDGAPGAAPSSVAAAAAALRLPASGLAARPTVAQAAAPPRAFGGLTKARTAEANLIEARPQPEDLSSRAGAAGLAPPSPSAAEGGVPPSAFAGRFAYPYQPRSSPNTRTLPSVHDLLRPDLDEHADVRASRLQRPSSAPLIRPSARGR